VLENLSGQLAATESLTDAQICQVVDELVDEGVPVATKAEFLSGLARKGETSAEIAVFARELGARAIRPVINGALRAREILDVVGTGGDRMSTFNISTATALVASAAGVLVAKHGNRASTIVHWQRGRAGGLRDSLRSGARGGGAFARATWFCLFLCAKYHPAFRHIVPARKLCAERGQRTIFNLLGPLLNPACPSAMLVGWPRPELC
jgi:anthranilate phosphoribosyltransferase